jgi:hypothetical protein
LTGTANDKINPTQHKDINIPEEPKMVWAWADATPGFTRGSMRARPERPRHSMRQKASAEPERTAAAMAAVNFILKKVKFLLYVCKYQQVEIGVGRLMLFRFAFPSLEYSILSSNDHKGVSWAITALKKNECCKEEAGSSRKERR